MLHQGPTLKKRTAQCKECNAPVIRVIFFADAHYQEKILLAYGLSPTCGFNLALGHKSLSDHMQSKGCFGLHNDELKPLMDHLCKCREQLLDGAASSGLALPHLHGLKVDESGEYAVRTPRCSPARAHRAGPQLTLPQPEPCP